MTTTSKVLIGVGAVALAATAFLGYRFLVPPTFTLRQWSNVTHQFKKVS